MVQMKNPPHPGLLVKNELDEMGIPISEAAQSLGVTRQALYNVVRGKAGISPEMAVRLSKGIGSTAAGWLQMQMTFDLAQLPQASIKVTRMKRRQHSPA